METTPITLKIDQLPLWRLLVALDDAERVAGSNSPTVRALAREIKRRLSCSIHNDERDITPPGEGGRS